MKMSKEKLMELFQDRILLKQYVKNTVVHLMKHLTTT